VVALHLQNGFERVVLLDPVFNLVFEVLLLKNVNLRDKVIQDVRILQVFHEQEFVADAQVGVELYLVVELVFVVFELVCHFLIFAVGFHQAFLQGDYTVEET